MPLCCASTRMKLSQGPALSHVRVESSLVLAMEIHALDSLVARDTTGHYHGGRVLLGAPSLGHGYATKLFAQYSSSSSSNQKTALTRRRKKSQKRPGTKSELQHRTWLPRNPQSRSAECCYLVQVLFTFLGSHTIFGHGYSRGSHTARIGSYLLLDTRE